MLPKSRVVTKGPPNPLDQVEEAAGVGAPVVMKTIEAQNFSHTIYCVANAA